MKYRVISYIRVEPDEEVDALYNTFEEAKVIKDHLEFVHDKEVKAFIEKVEEE